MRAGTVPPPCVAAEERLGEDGEAAHNIADLGDEALWPPVPGGVYLFKGRYSVQVNGPKGEPTQIRIAKRLIGEE